MRQVFYKLIIVANDQTNFKFFINLNMNSASRLYNCNIITNRTSLFHNIMFHYIEIKPQLGIYISSLSTLTH